MLTKNVVNYDSFPIKNLFETIIYSIKSGINASKKEEIFLKNKFSSKKLSQ
jgi:hypothetical protein